MGDVEEVFDSRLERCIARKRARFDPADEELFARFVAEAQITGQLAHPGIAPVHELGVDAQGRPYFTMVRIVGEDLGQIFARARAGADRSSSASPPTPGNGPGSAVLGGARAGKEQELAFEPELAAERDRAAGARASLASHASWEDESANANRSDVAIVERVSLPQCVRVLISVCETIAVAHERGVVHRDLKPANVRVGPFGEILVLDWGLARVLPESPIRTELGGELARLDDEAERRRGAGTGAASGEVGLAPGQTRHVAFLGTAGYMAPEQAVGHASEATPLADVYAVGAMLYEALAGFPPYGRPGPVGSAPSFPEHLERVRAGDPESLERVAPAAPAPLVAVARRALARRPEERYASALDLADDLRRYLEGRVVRAHRTGAWAELHAWVRRHRSTARAVTLGVLVALVGLAGAAAVQARHRARIEPFVRAGRAKELLDWSHGLHPASSENLASLTLLRDHMEFVASPPLVDAARERRAGLLARGEPLLEGRVEPALLRGELVELQEAPGETLAVALSLEFLAHWSRAGLGDVERLRGHVRAAVRGLEWAASQRDPSGTFRFADGEDAAEYAALSLYLDTVERIRERPWTEDGLEDVRARAAFAGAVRAATVTSPHAAAAWEAAAQRVRADPRFGGLLLAPQEGLLPRGPDPQSGLEEFSVVGTGDVEGLPAPLHPWRQLEPRNGEPRSTAPIVLVLVPGGRFPAEWLVEGPQGRETGQEPGRQAEQDLGEVEVEPGFFGKHEITHGQWRAVLHAYSGYYGVNWRATGVEPVGEDAPAHLISFPRGVQYARRVGLSIPTEAQWVWAASAGASDELWRVPGARPARDAGNFEGLVGRDSYLVISPVDAFPPNAWGIHGTLGNVIEWCQPLVGDQGVEAYRARGACSATPYTAVRVRARQNPSGGDALRTIGLRLTRRLELDERTQP